MCTPEKMCHEHTLELDSAVTAGLRDQSEVVSAKFHEANAAMDANDIQGGEELMQQAEALYATWTDWYVEWRAHAGLD